MEQYIDKSALVAEIEKRQSILDLDNPLGRGGMVELECLKNSLDTLEVKEVQGESVSNDLEDYANKESESFAEREYEIDYIDRHALAKGYYWGVKSGAKWQKKQMSTWSEEDEEIMSGLLSFLLINTSDQWAKYGKWLESLKQRIGE